MLELASNAMPCGLFKVVVVTTLDMMPVLLVTLRILEL